MSRTLLIEAAYINGRWIESDSRIEVTNPANGQIIGTVPNLGAAEAEAAVEAAESAGSAWRARDPLERADILHEWNRRILAEQEALAHLMIAEQGKPMAEAMGEIAYAASYVRWFAEEARRIEGVIIGNGPDRELRVYREPVGVVAAITPWNFPSAMITRKVAPALAVGCTVVLKPSELTPFSALALAKLAHEAGIPPGVFNVVTGDARAIGAVLTDDPRVRKFTFTGSTAVGKMLAARCAGTVKRVSLELGGNAPFLIFDDADIDAAVSGLIASKFRNSGQTCVCANRIYVQQGIYEKFTTALLTAVAKLRPGEGTESGVNQGPLINEAAVAKAQRHIADAIEGGARVRAGGSVMDRPGTFFEPTVLDRVQSDALMCREETFAPVAGLVSFASEAEVIGLANATSAGLASYIFTRDHARIRRVSAALEYGMVGVNTGLISTAIAPFGGVKESGMGREGSRFGIEDYTNLKLVCDAM